MFSKTCKYAIKALIFIAQKTNNERKVGIKDVAEGIDSPEHFIAKILQTLSKKGFVNSSKGPNGGFYMDENTLEVTLADVVKEIDGDKILYGCGIGLKQCSETHPCPIHNDFKVIREQIVEMLEKSKIRMFIENLDQNITFLKT
ncbi:Rrf2 family transcriptional regulator [Bergeyella porcorum]|uniref:Rrf2 family transcriptional regulator n=1 Tax=Bergeyella porcorum TaxID=1735111 RepID=A0AAU0EXU8_9FLAO